MKMRATLLSFLMVLGIGATHLEAGYNDALAKIADGANIQENTVVVNKAAALGATGFSAYLMAKEIRKSKEEKRKVSKMKCGTYGFAMLLCGAYLISEFIK